MDYDWQPIELGLGPEQALECFYRSAVDNNLPFAMWRHPRNHEKQAMVDLSGEAKPARIDFQRLPAGFLIAPFHPTSRDSCQYVRADVLLQGSKCMFRDWSNGGSNLRDRRARAERLLRQFSRPVNGKSKSRRQPRWFTPSDKNFGGNSPTKQEYCALVDKSVGEITKGTFKKVVLSRALEVELQASFDPFFLFNTLCDAYTNAFVSLIALPGHGTWLGATPELLFRLSGNSLTTVALAGTRPATPGSTSWQGDWGEKEIVEQAIVSEFIRNRFAEHGISDFSEARTESVRIGDLLHLQTRFSLQNVANHGSHIAENLLVSLHPTPAVCGVPQQAAMAFIEAEEAHHRDFYAGYLGPVNLAGETNLYVNLRCMQLRTDTAVLYAGGGITIDSDPEQEWLETELKFDALRKFLNHELYSVDSTGGATSKVLCYE